MLDAKIPAGYTNVTPYLVVPDVKGQIDFLRQALDAEVTFEPILRDDGSIMHAEVRVGNALIMMGGSTDVHAPIPAMLYVYVDDADDRYERALDAGGTSLMEPSDQPHGDRYGGVQDQNGNQWYMAQRLREVTTDE